jgi:hypothetical protein
VKGNIRIYFIVLVIAVIVLVLALYPLKDVFGLEILFPSDLTTLKQYSTCALAYCAAGAGSDEVNAVGCLKFEGGKCILSCAQVEKEVYLKNNVAPTVTEIGGRGAPHYCGSDAALEFEFSGVSLGGVVPLASGQMDKIATKPQWVCKPYKVPFTDVDLDSIPGLNLADTALAQHSGFAGFLPQNCIILSGKVLFEGLGLPTTRNGCFQVIKYDKSYDSIYYTPLIQYDDPKQIIYPSAIYVDRSFTEPLEGSKPECDFRNAPNRKTVSEEEITQRIREIVNYPALDIEGKPTDKTNQEYFEELGKIGEKDVCVDKSCTNKITQEQKKFIDFFDANYLGDASAPENNLIGNFLNRCNFKTTHKGEKMKYRVWAKPVYPTIDELKKATGFEGFQNFIQKILSPLSEDLSDAFGITIAKTEEFATLVFSQLGGSCTAVVLERDLKDTLVAEPAEQETSTGQQIKITVNGDKTSYAKDETVTFSGTLRDGDLLLANREVKLTLDLLLEISPRPVSVAIQRVVTDGNGKFVWQTQLGGDFKTNYQIIAEYKKVESEPFKFTVG